MENKEFKHHTSITTASEAEWEAKHKTIMAKVPDRGINCAKRNQPDLKGDSIETYIGDFSAEYDGLKVRIEQELQPATSKTEAKMKNQEADRKLKANSQKKKEAETGKHNFLLDLEQKGLKPEDLIVMPQNKRKSDIFMIAINCIDVGIAATALQLLGFNMLFAVVIAVCFSLMVFYAAKLLGEHLKEDTEDANKKKFIAIVGTLLVFGLFYFFAMLRAQHLKEHNFVVHPLWLTLLNVVCYIITVVHFYKYTKTEAQKKEEEIIKHYQKILQEFEDQIAECEANEKAMLEEKANMQNFLMHKPGYALTMMSRVDAWKLEMIKCFIFHNTTNRQDRKSPDCFKPYTNS